MLFVLSNQCWKINAFINKEISQKTNKNPCILVNTMLYKQLVYKNSLIQIFYNSQFSVPIEDTFSQKFIMQMLVTETSWRTLFKSNCQERIIHLKAFCHYFFFQLLKNSPYPTKNWPHTSIIRVIHGGRNQNPTFWLSCDHLDVERTKKVNIVVTWSFFLDHSSAVYKQQSFGCLNKTASSTRFPSLFAADISAIVTWEDRSWFLIY